MSKDSKGLWKHRNEGSADGWNVRHCGATDIGGIDLLKGEPCFY